MKNVRWYWVLFGIAAALAIVPGCAKNNAGGGGGTIPSTSPSGSPTAPPPTECPTENPNTNGNLVVVDMTTQAAPTKDPQYGSINGYVVENPLGEDTQAGLIDHWYPPNASTSPEPITSNNILQFANTDESGVSHSAVYITDKLPWPPDSYTFPVNAASPSPNTVIGSGFWSTGIWPPFGGGPSGGSGGQCFSQTFTLKPGTYFFGDYTYYDLSLMRDVLIVKSAAAVRRTRFTRGIRAIR